MIVGTANLRHGVDHEGALRIAEIASALAALEWDVLAVQELDRFAARSSRTDQPRLLMEACRAEGRFVTTLSHGGGDYGIVILCRRTAVSEVSELRLPVGDENEPRAAATVQLEDGARIAATHLGPNGDWAARGLASLMSLAKPPDVIAGDLNLDPRGLDLPHPWSPAGNGHAHATFPAHDPSAWIDHVLYREDAWRDVRSWTAELPATDHLAFFTELEALPARPPA